MISDGGSGYSLTKTGNRILALSGANTFSGGFFWNAGSISIGNSAAFGSGTLTTNGGSFNLIARGAYELANAVSLGGTLSRGATFGPGSGNGQLTFAGPITLTNNATINHGGSASNTHQIIFASNAAITCTFGFTFSGSQNRETRIQSQNTYTGVTTVSGSAFVLQLAGGDDRLPTTGALNMGDTLLNNPRIQLLGGISQPVGSLAGHGRIELSGGAFTAGGNNLSTAFSGTFSGAGGSRLVKVGTGTLTLSGSSTHAGGTTVSGGVLRISNASALGTGTAGVNGGTLDLNGFNVTMNAFSIGGATGAGLLTGGTITIPGNVAYVSTPGGVVIDDNLSLVNSGTGWRFDVGGDGSGADALTFARTISTGSVTKTNSGRLVITTTANSYAGRTIISGGVLEAAVLADEGVASTIGAATGADATIDLGSGAATGTLRYTGTGHSTNRAIELSGSSGGGGLDASGSGAVAFTGSITAAAGTKTFTLSGTSTGDNFIGAIGGTGISVTKTGAGTWVLGTNSFTGTLAVREGTLVADGGAPTTGSGVFGADSSDRPEIGQADTGGTVSFLVVAGGTIARSFDVIGAGTTGTQEVVIGGTGAGSARFAGTAGIRLDRDVTLAADAGHDVVFLNPWQTLAGGTNPGPAVAFNVGSATATGTVTLGSFVPESITAVNVRRGMLRLDLSGGDTLGVATPLTVGSNLASVTVDLAGKSQALQSLTFGGTAPVVPSGTAGVLRLAGSAPKVTAASGAGHRIESGIALDATATFDVAAAAAWLTVTNAITNGTNGARGLVKSGSGTLALTGSSSYTGATAVNAGTLVVDGVLGSTAVTIASGATLSGTGTLGGFTSILGTHSPRASPGIETFTNGISYGAASTLVWELIANNSDALQRGILFYGVDLTGGALSITSGATLSLVFDLPGSTVDWDDGFWASGQTWTVIDVSGSGTWNNSLFTTLAVGNDSTNASLASKRPDSTFQIVQSGGDLVLQYVVVIPEPGTLALAGLGLAALGFAAGRPRRKRRSR